jgi:predicted DNA-binding protein
MLQQPTSVNHRALNGKPVLQFPPPQKQRVTVSLPTPLIERLRNAVYWTGHRPLVGLVAEAIEDIVAQMEEVNGGAFPQRISPLKRGRQRKRSSGPPHHDPFS